MFLMHRVARELSSSSSRCWHGLTRALTLSPEENADVTGSVETPGLEHTIHNATNDLGRVMKGFAEATAQLKEVCRMLSKHEARVQLLENCFHARGAFYLRGCSVHCPLTRRTKS